MLIGAEYVLNRFHEEKYSPSSVFCFPYLLQFLYKKAILFNAQGVSKTYKKSKVLQFLRCTELSLYVLRVCFFFNVSQIFFGNEKFFLHSLDSRHLCTKVELLS